MEAKNIHKNTLKFKLNLYKIKKDIEIKIVINFRVFK